MLSHGHDQQPVRRREAGQRGRRPAAFFTIQVLPHGAQHHQRYRPRGHHAAKQVRAAPEDDLKDQRQAPRRGAPEVEKALTQEAYNLRQITVKPIPAERGLTFQSLQDNHATIDNIRLWDWEPLIDTYAQMQEIRTYYKFLDVNVDRYDLSGSYQQVMLSHGTSP